MLQVAYGLEAYKLDLLKETELKGLNEFSRKSFQGLSKEILTFLETEQLMGGKKVAIIHVSDLSELDGPLFHTIHDNYGKVSNISILICGKTADKRKKFVKELLTKPFVKACGRCASEPELAKIIRYEAKANGCVFEPAAENHFITRTGYLVDESVSLYHIKNLILDLSELAENGTITEELVTAVVPENILYNAFSLTSLIESGKIREVKKQSEKIKEGGAIQAISAMLYDFRTSYKIKLGFSKSEVGVFKDSPYLKYSSAQLLQCINTCTETVEKIKNGEIAEKDALMYASLEITRIIKK